MVKRFGDFEFDDRRRELRAGAQPVRLNSQALDLLHLLLERAGEVVTREEIHRALWPNTNVDFEHGLDVAVSRLRIALGDRSPNPRFIQTLPKKGYRFIEPVTVAAEERSPRPLARWTRRIVTYVGVAIMGALLAVLFARTRYDKFVSPHVSQASPAARHR